MDEMRGGSTITQQVAKNLFLWQGRSYVRKALEFPLALWIDLILPKRRDSGNLPQYRRVGSRTVNSAPRLAPGAPSASRLMTLSRL